MLLVAIDDVLVDNLGLLLPATPAAEALMAAKNFMPGAKMTPMQFT